MNSKLLFVATMGLALASSLALAEETPGARATPTAPVAQPSTGSLRRTDYDDELAARPALSSQVSRDDVLAALQAPRDARLVGPLRSRTYNPYGVETMRDPIVSRADVKADVLAARAEHSLRPAGEAGDLWVAATTTRREAPHQVALQRTGN